MSKKSMYNKPMKNIVRAEDLEFNDKEYRGKQCRVMFDNGYGASVITGGYGDEYSPYEIAVLDGDRITYDTPITDDVLGYLNSENVSSLLQEISELPSIEEGKSNE